ncbi:MAG: APC family permease [Ferruginibacter sp.]
MESKKIKIFPRPASGLTKSIGLIGAIVFGIHCISLSSSGFIPFSFVSSVWPGANIVWLLVIAMVTSIIHGTTFAGIGIAMPRSGADYVLASRVLNPTIAFIASWTLVIFSGVVVGGLIAFIPKSAFPALFQPMSIIFKNSSYSNIADYASSANGTFIIGSICIVITFISVCLPNKTIQRLLTIGLTLGLIAWVGILMVLYFTHDPNSFKEGWNNFMGNSSSYGTYDKRIELAHAAGMKISGDWQTMTFAGLIMGFWIFYGYYIPTFFAGEIKDNKRSNTLIVGSLSSILITGFIFILAIVLLQKFVSPEWIASEGFIFNNGTDVEKTAGQPITGYPWITFYAAILYPKFWFVLGIALCWIFTLINLAQTYFYYGSRIIFSWAFDRVMPEKLTTIYRKTGSPIYCMMVIAILAFIGLWDASYNQGVLGTQLSFAFFAVVTQLVSVIAIIIFPFKMKEQFRLCPHWMQRKILGIPFISLIGSVTLCYLLWMIFASFYFPAVGVTKPIQTLITLGIISFIGFIVFRSARIRLLKNEGIDIDLIYSNNPPE